MSGKFDFNTVFHQMSLEEIEMATIALERQMAADRKASKGK